MKNFKQILEEVNYTLSVFMIFDTLLTAAIAFLVSYLILSFFNIYGYWSFILAAVVFLWESWQRVRKNKLRIVEDSYDFLREKLTTAKDYLAVKNPFVEDLQEEVSEDIKKVSSGAFFNEKKTNIKIAAIICLCILIVVLAPYNIVLFDFNKAVSDIVKIRNRTIEAKIVKPEYELISVEDEWYGEFSLGQLGEEEMQVQLIESNYKLTSDIVQDPEKKDFEEMYPEGVTVSRAGSYNARIEEENQEIVKNYFKNIAK